MEKVKATLRIPTKQQYAYIEIVIEGTAQEIVETYLRFTDVYWTAQKRFDKDAPPF